MHGVRRFLLRRLARATAVSAFGGLALAALAADEAPASPTPDATAGIPHVSPLRLSGFATLGVVDSRMDAPWVFRRDSLQPGGPHDGVRTRVDSRLGLQANLALSPQLEAVAQAVLKPMPDGASPGQRIEWALLAYRPAPDWTVRMGRVSNDMRLVSEYTNVGFAYPWVRPSQEIYGLMSFTSVDGVDVQKSWMSGGARWRAKVQLGQTRMQAPPTELSSLEVRGRDMLSATFEREEGGLLLKASAAYGRMSFHTGLDAGPLLAVLDQVRQVPLPSVSGEAAALRSAFPTGAMTLRSAALGLLYRTGPWLTHTEVAITDIRETSASDVSGYASLAYRVGAVTLFGTAGAVSPRQPAAQAPTNWAAALTPIVGPVNAAAAQGAGSLAAAILNAARIDQRSLSAGVRWDVHPQVALKAQVDHIRVRPNGSALWAHATPGARSANVLSFVVDAVF